MSQKSERLGREDLLEKARFAIVGFVNTAVDFTVLNLLVIFIHLPIITANIVSTLTAMLVSLMLNKTVVFRDSKPLTKRSFALFIGVTLSSLWIVQSLVLFILTQQFPHPLTTIAHELALYTHTSMSGESFFRNNLSKIIATIASLIWNYYFYKRLVFKKDKA